MGNKQKNDTITISISLKQKLNHPAATWLSSCSEQEWSLNNHPSPFSKSQQCQNERKRKVSCGHVKGGHASKTVNLNKPRCYCKCDLRNNQLERLSKSLSVLFGKWKIMTTTKFPKNNSFSFISKVGASFSKDSEWVFLHVFFLSSNYVLLYFCQVVHVKYIIVGTTQRDLLLDVFIFLIPLCT